MFKKKIFVKDSKNFFLQNFKLEFHVNDNFKQFLPSKVFSKNAFFPVIFYYFRKIMFLITEKHIFSKSFVEQKSF